jgi:hypothetical protein
MEEDESHSHLPSITSYVFYFIEVEAAYFTVLRDCERGTGLRRETRCNRQVAPTPSQGTCPTAAVEPPFSFFNQDVDSSIDFIQRVHPD